MVEREVQREAQRKAEWDEEQRIREFNEEVRTRKHAPLKLRIESQRCVNDRQRPRLTQIKPKQRSPPLALKLGLIPSISQCL